MFRRDKLISGLVFGILLPVIGFFLFFNIFKLLDVLNAASSDGFGSNFRERTLAIVAIGLNIIPLRIFSARRANNALRGLVIATFCLAALWFYQYGLRMI